MCFQSIVEVPYALSHMCEHRIRMHIEIFHRCTKEQPINGYWNIVFTLYAQTLIQLIENSLHLQ